MRYERAGIGRLAISTKAEARSTLHHRYSERQNIETRHRGGTMNRNKLLVIAVLALVGAGLGIASAQLMAPQSPVEDTVLYSAEAYGNSNDTDIGMVSIYAASGYGFDGGMEIEPPREPTPEERQKAIDIALSDSKVKDLLDDLLDGREYEIDYVDCMPSLSGQDTHASVDINIPNASEGDPAYILVLVNLDDETVIDVMPIVDSPREPTAEERQKAIDIALSDSKVKDLLDGREYEIDYVELNGLDTHALVEIYFPNASEGDLWYLSVLVNLDKKTVVDVIPEGMGGYLPLPEPEPLTPEEEKRVIAIALQDPTVKELLKGRAYNISEAFVYAMPENERLAEVEIYIPNMYANMSAYMMVGVNLNESAMEHLSFEMFPADDSWSMSYDGATGVDCGVSTVGAES